MKLIEALGLDYRILLAQLFNFTILLAILYKLGYKPILKFVQDRTEKIEAGVKDAEAAKQAVIDGGARQKEILAEARIEAQDILAKAREQADQQGEALVLKSKQSAQHVIEKAKKDIRAEHEQMVEAAKKDVAGMVLQVTETLLREKMDITKDVAFVESTLKELKS